MFFFFLKVPSTSEAATRIHSVIVVAAEQLLSLKSFWWIHKIRKELYHHNDCHTCYGQCGLSLCEQKGPSWLCVGSPLFYIFIVFFPTCCPLSPFYENISVFDIFSPNSFVFLYVILLLLYSSVFHNHPLSLSLKQTYRKLLHLRLYNKNKKASKL